ncbi:hypothetical protein ACWEQP_09220 [Streptomyces sp. NPDC004044]
MTMDQITRTLHETGVTALVGNARLGHHTLPDGMVDDYTQLEEYIAEHTDRWGGTSDPKVLRAAQAMADKASGYIAWGASTTTITEHLQPAMARLLDDVQADIQAAGRHALAVAPTVDMLTEPDEVRAAIVRLSSLHPRYGALRVSWEFLRQRDASNTIDPLGLRSPLAEVANLPDVFSDWEKAAHGRAPWPWTSSHLGVKLGWLLDNGGQVWLPTTAEQNAAWKRYNPQVKAAA